MKPNDLFIGPLRYWLIWPAVVVVLFACGSYSLHVRNFVPFIFVLLLLVSVVVILVIWSYRDHERVTREPIEDDQSAEL